MALLGGALLSLLLGVYGAKHEPTTQVITTLGFGNLIEMKVWLAVATGVLGLLQLGGALWMYGRFRVAAPSWVGIAHRACGYLALLVSLPVAYSCLWALGFQYSDARVLTHSLVGCAFYGAFVVKVAAVLKDSTTVGPALGRQRNVHAAGRGGGDLSRVVSHPDRSAVQQPLLTRAAALFRRWTAGGRRR